MSAFVIVDTRIENPNAYEHYKTAARPIVERHGGVYRVRGGAMEVVENDLWMPSRIVIVEFPDMDSARAFVNSEEYAPVKVLRHRTAKCTLAIVDGLPED